MTSKIEVLIALNCIETASGCWEYQGSTDKDGYGVITFGGDYFRTHVAMYTAHGPIPIGMMVCHHCDNPPCCNPAHLFAGTAQQNTLDSHEKGRAAGQFKSGIHHTNAKLTVEQVKEIRSTPVYHGSGKFLALKYGVSRATIADVRNNKSYLLDS